MSERPTEVPITTLAKNLGVSLRTLRFYEGKGLLNPRRHGVFRFYDETQRKRAEHIITAKRCGMTIAEIKQRLHDEGVDLDRAFALELIARLRDQRSEIEMGLIDLEKFLATKAAA